LSTVTSTDTVATTILSDTAELLAPVSAYPPVEQRRESAVDEVGKVLDLYYRPNSSSHLLPNTIGGGGAKRGYSPLR
jgi:hypothetical protein